MWTGPYSPHSRMADYFRNHGLTATQTEATPHSTAIAEISAGRPFSMCVMLTSAGHLVLAHGIGAEPHTLIFNDPYGNKNNGYKNYLGKNVSYDWPGYNNGFQNLTGVAWCIAAQYSAPAPSDTLVDDADLDRGFYLHTQPPSSMSMWKDANTGYQGHMWYTLTRAQGTADTCYGVWTPSLPVAGSYEVLVYIPNATATAATYLVNCSQGSKSIVVDQNANKYSWVSLGTYNFDQGSSGSVRLGDGSMVTGEALAFDAVRWSYRGGQTTAIKTEGALPKTWVLYQNFPNPFNPSTNVRFYIPASAAVRLDILNSLGETVAALVDGTEREGYHEIRWDSRNISSGVYFLRMTVQGLSGGGPLVATKTMLLLR